MAGLRRRSRNSRTLVVRNQMLDEAGYYADLAQATPGQRATALIVETGDLLLELLITTATESLSRASRNERRRDAKALTSALGEQGRVRDAWTFLTHGTAIRAREAATEEGANASAHTAARELLAAHHPLSADDEGVLATAPDAERLGYWGMDWVLTQAAFTQLLGPEGANGLALFSDVESVTDLQLLNIAWNHGAAPYLELLAQGAVTSSDPRSA